MCVAHYIANLTGESEVKMNAMALATLITILPIGLLMSAMPYLTRKTISFGVSIEERYYHDPEIRRMRSLYSLGAGTASVVALAVSLWATSALDERQYAWVFSATLLGLLAVLWGLYLVFHFRMREMKRSKGLLSAEVQQTVVETGFYHQKRAFSPAWLLPHLLVTAATAWICLYYYDQFPEQIVMQVDFRGNPTNVVDKSYATVLMPAGVQLFLVFIFGVVNYVIASSKQQLDAARPKQSLRQNLKFRRAWSGYLLLSSFLLVVSFAFIPLQMLLQFDPMHLSMVFLVATAVMLVGAMVLSLKMGQGGSRIPVEGNGAEAGRVNRDDDRYWKLGEFYFNPDDPALFLEKRFGIGWTINLARPMAWVILLGPVALLVGYLLWTQMMSR